MKIASTELEDYIRSTLASIKKGVHSDDSFRLHGLIEFDLAVTNLREGKAGLKVYVVETEGKTKSERVSHIKFKVTPYADIKKYSPNATRTNAPEKKQQSKN